MMDVPVRFMVVFALGDRATNGIKDGLVVGVTRKQSVSLLCGLTFGQDRYMRMPRRCGDIYSALGKMRLKNTEQRILPSRTRKSFSRYAKRIARVTVPGAQLCARQTCHR